VRHEKIAALERSGIRIAATGRLSRFCFVQRPNEGSIEFNAIATPIPPARKENAINIVSLSDLA
jgi:hypothetical protein